MTPEQLAALVADLRYGCNLQQRDGERAADAIEHLQAEVARLSTPPDDAEMVSLTGEAHSMSRQAARPLWQDVSRLIDAMADALTRLSHALAAEKAKREAMEIKAAKLWMLLDDIDTQDDASREDNLHFRDATWRHQKRRFSILHENEAEELLKKGAKK